jgi:hypothetical protein
MRSGLGQTDMAMDEESLFCRQWPAMDSGNQLSDEALLAVAVVP